MVYYKVIAENRKARHDYTIIEVIQAGIALAGTEVKSIREGKVNLKDSFARVEHGEVWLYNMHVSSYEKGSRYNLKPERPRKLLLNKGEIKKLIGRTSEKGLTLVPLKLYALRDWIKIELALAKPKKLYEKRESIRKKEAEREVERALSLRKGK